MKKCAFCSVLVEAELKQCPECDCAEFQEANIELDTPYFYEVMLAKEIDAVPGQPEYDKYSKWQEKVLDHTKRFKDNFDEVSCAVTKFQENDVSVTYGTMRITWGFSFEDALASFELVQVLVKRHELFEDCQVEHYLNDSVSEEDES